jgi:hypothetical protein
MGRRLYETMLYWETADQDRSLDDAELEWTALWKPLPKVVFSNTLSVEKGNARLASHSVAEEIERLRARTFSSRVRLPPLPGGALARLPVKRAYVVGQGTVQRCTW